MYNGLKGKLRRKGYPFPFPAGKDSLINHSLFSGAVDISDLNFMKERFEKNRIVLLVAMAVAFTLSLVSLSACGNTTEQRSRIKVVYELEGGKYLNSELPVVVYYDFGNNSFNHNWGEE